MSLCLLSSWLFGQTPVEVNGRLSVVGKQLVNEHGNPVQLRGMSTHGIQWYGWGDCLTESSLDALAYDWGSDILRISLYVQEGGWDTDPAGYEAQVNALIQEATDRGMYALVDWHQLSPGDPNANTANAKLFFQNICTANASRNNIIYDIANEPNNVEWSAIKTYAEEMIPFLRLYDDDAVILCGTHGWGSLGVSDDWAGSSQVIIDNPVNATNFMYTFHFYAKDHQQTYYDEFDSFSDTLPIFVTEWGSQEASGDGVNDFVMAQQYIDLMAAKKISWCNWNYSDDSRTGAVWNTGTCSGGPWTVANLKPAGAWVRDKMLIPVDDFQGSTNEDPTVSITAPTDGGTFEIGDDIVIEVAAADADGNVVSVEFFNGATSLGVDNSSPYSFTISSAIEGTYVLTAVATDDEAAETTFSIVTVTVSVAQGPFGGVAWAIPGTLEAEDYDVGGAGVAFYETSLTNEAGSTYRNDAVDIEDITGGYGLGYTDDGEWLDYSVDIASTGEYTINFTVAADDAFGGSFKLLLDDNEVLGSTISGTTGGWTIWDDVSVSDVSLTAGEHVLTLEIMTGDFNIDKMIFAKDVLSTNMEDASLDAFYVYPNPSSESLFVSIPDHLDGGTLKIIDMNGRLVHTQLCGNQESLTLDISAFNTGSYTCILQTANGVKQVKLMKQ